MSTELQIPAAEPLAYLPPAAHRPAAARIRLEYLDGIRGLTALYVVFNHIVCQTDGAGLWPWLAYVLGLSMAAHTAVSIFIVLSGYCLMLPVVRAPGGDSDPCTLAGVRSFLGRRARRILPPYYATLALFLLVMTAIPGGPHSVGHWWSTMWPVFTPGVLISHLLLAHNLSEHWVYKIDAPMWSIATEWQIYFLFPLILLPVLRRLGAMTAIVTGIAIGLAPLYLFGKLEWASPWFVGLFAMGMAAAQHYPGLEARPSWQKKLPWGWFCIALALLLAAIYNWGGRLSIRDNWKFQFMVDVFSGLCTASFIIWAAARSAMEHSRRAQRRSLVLRALTSTWAMRIGAFSYSLYLTHALPTALTEILLSKLPLGPNERALTFLALGPLVAMGFAYLFYLAFERPFLRQRASIRQADPMPAAPSTNPAHFLTTTAVDS